MLRASSQAKRLTAAAATASGLRRSAAASALSAHSHHVHPHHLHALLSQALPTAAYPTPFQQFAAALQACMARGELVPDAVVQRLLAARLRAPDVAARGFALDGFPRSASQAEGLLVSSVVAPEVLVELDVDFESAVRRIARRGAGRVDDEDVAVVRRRVGEWDAVRDGVVRVLEEGGVRIEVVGAGGGRAKEEVVAEVRERVGGARRILLAGRAGCGKSVAGRALADGGGPVHVSSGEILREVCAAGAGLRGVLL